MSVFRSCYSREILRFAQNDTPFKNAFCFLVEQK